MLSTAAVNDVIVNYATADGTATSGSSGQDFLATTGTLRIAAGATSGSIAVEVIGDALIEADETFLLNLSNPGGATIADGQALITIANDDTTTTTTTTKGNNGQGKGAASAQRAAAAARFDPITGIQASNDSLAGVKGFGPASQKSRSSTAGLQPRPGDDLEHEDVLPKDTLLAWIAEPLPPLAAVGPGGWKREGLPGTLAAEPAWMLAAAPPLAAF